MDCCQYPQEYGGSILRKETGITSRNEEKGNCWEREII